MRILNNTKIRKNTYLNEVWSIEFHCYISLFRNAFNRLSLLADPLLIPSTIMTRSRHSMGYDLLIIFGQAEGSFLQPFYIQGKTAIFRMQKFHRGPLAIYENEYVT